MSTRGYEVYDPETLKSLGNKATDGKAKHIAKSGNKIATLYYNERPSSDATAVSGTVEIYNTGADILNGNPSQKINVESIAPMMVRIQLPLMETMSMFVEAEKVFLVMT